MGVELSEVERKIRDAYTEKKKCVVWGWPDAHTAWLRVRNQDFCVTATVMETAEEAEEMRAMLAKTLVSLIKREAAEAVVNW